MHAFWCALLLVSLVFGAVFLGGSASLHDWFFALFGKVICIGLIMGGKLYEPEGRIECASHDQTYLVRGWGRGCGLNMMACVSMFSEI